MVVVVASGGPYANHLHLAPCQYLISQFFRSQILFLMLNQQCQSNNNNHFTAFVRDYPGVPEETLTHPPSWSSSNFYQLPRTTIHSILPVQISCLAIFLHNLCPRPFWSASWSGALYLIFHTFLHPISVKVLKAIICRRVLNQIKMFSTNHTVLAGPSVKSYRQWDRCVMLNCRCINCLQQLDNWLVAVWLYPALSPDWRVPRECVWLSSCTKCSKRTTGFVCCGNTTAYSRWPTSAFCFIMLCVGWHILGVSPYTWASPLKLPKYY